MTWSNRCWPNIRLRINSYSLRPPNYILLKCLQMLLRPSVSRRRFWTSSAPFLLWSGLVDSKQLKTENLFREASHNLQECHPKTLTIAPLWKNLKLRCCLLSMLTGRRQWQWTQFLNYLRVLTLKIRLPPLLKRTLLHLLTKSNLHQKRRCRRGCSVLNPSLTDQWLKVIIRFRLRQSKSSH